ncbi:MAG: hypothetical protein RBS57_07335, partial [Desulforhabdus sp.]|nr:hypothetical protein [Desulforhabdus sp.]
LFYQEFLDSVRAFGRVFETGLLPLFNFKAKKPFNDMDLAPQVIKKGKLALLPHRIKGRKQVAQIFERFEARRTNQEADNK